MLHGSIVERWVLRSQRKYATTLYVATLMWFAKRYSFLMKENINNSRRSSVALTSCFQHRPGSTAEIMKSIMRCWFITLHHRSQQNSAGECALLNVWCTLNGRPQSTGSKHWLRAERLKNWISVLYVLMPLFSRSLPLNIRRYMFYFLLQMFYT